MSMLVVAYVICLKSSDQVIWRVDGAPHRYRLPVQLTVQLLCKGVCIAIYGNPSHNYGVSLAVWDHTVLPASRHKRTHPKV